ncbi:MAG: 3-isopropylmalate dehydrogenase [Cardiobacteriaceae bacterium]|nr:3-isopropylmalate dehydrogenase [Cardiobacteriaceae bacterium]
MKTFNIVCLPGDGIGPEIVESAKAVLDAVCPRFGLALNFQDFAFGGAGIDHYGEPYAPEVRDAVLASDAVFLGAVGGPKWDDAPVRPEAGLLALRKSLDLFANVRPLAVSGALVAHSPLKREIVEGTDLVIVRELSAGAYFGEPRRLDETEALDSITYTRAEIERVVRYAFEMARTRRKKLTSVDKANVIATSKLWRKVVNEMAADYPDVALEHMLVDAMAMTLVTQPTAYDVIVTENLFGDILSDEASVLGGSLGVLASASFGSLGIALYEPSHGSAPDIAGKGIANPIATILSAAMMLRHSCAADDAARAIEAGIATMMENDWLTADLNRENPLNTKAFTDKLIQHIPA